MSEAQRIHDEMEQAVDSAEREMTDACTNLQIGVQALRLLAGTGDVIPPDVRLEAALALVEMGR